VTAWLLDGDPAIRWQVLRDLTDAPAQVVAAERARVAREGWGAHVLGLRDPDGQWAGGAYMPAGFDDPGDEEAGGEPGGPDPTEVQEPPEDWDTEPQPWIATTAALLLLRDLGADPADPVVRDAVAAVAEHSRWEEGGQRYFDGEVEACINGMAVAIGATFGQPVDAVVARLVGEQLEDGGWNCWAPYGARRSSFHSTITVLEGLLAHERATGGTPASRAARARGEEYLLARRLLRRRSTGEVIAQRWTQLAFPTRWHYDVLRGLEHLRAAGGPPDPRLAEAVALVAAKRGADGRWLLDHAHPGEDLLVMELVGEPSRWITLRALRVLRWYEADADADASR
jgi:hypothetical protein